MVKWRAEVERVKTETSFFQKVLTLAVVGVKALWMVMLNKRARENNLPK
jgi:hypothetical protein